MWSAWITGLDAERIGRKREQHDDSDHSPSSLALSREPGYFSDCFILGLVHVLALVANYRPCSELPTALR